MPQQTTHTNNKHRYTQPYRTLKQVRKEDGMHRLIRPLRLVALAAALLLTAACGGVDRPLPDETASAVIVSPDTVEITVGDSAQLSATVEGEGEPAQDVHWSTSDEEVATVDDAGLVTGVGEGEAVVTAVSAVDPDVSSDAHIAVTAETETEDAGELMPGEMTQFVGDLGIGTHPDALVEPFEVEIEWFDPTGDPKFPSAERGVNRVDRFVQIRAPDVDEPWVDTPVDTGFIVVLPVPEEFDESRLYPLQYMYGDFVEFDAGHEEEHNHDHGDAPDVWAPISGVFDPKHRVFLVALPTMAGRDYPVRLGIVEHQTRATKKSQEVLDEIMEELFSGSESAAGAPAEGPDGNDIGVTDHRSLHSARFRVSCQVEDCASAADVVDTMDDALDEALAVYHEMNDSPQPRLRTTLLSRLNPFRSTYRYYVMDEHSDGLCDGFRGFYRRGQRLAVTCMNAANEGLERVALTTAHELFHAMQYGYGHSGRDSFLLEGTARLAEDVSAPLEVSGTEDPPRLDVAFTDERPYRGEYFFRYLFSREGLGFERMGDLFAKGLHLEHLDEFLQRHTSFTELGDAYWAWAKDQAFEKSVPLGPDRHGNPVPAGAVCELSDRVTEAADITVTAESAGEAGASFTLEPMTAKVFAATVDFDDPDLQSYSTRATISHVFGDGDVSFLTMKRYFASDVTTLHCLERSDIADVERGAWYQWRGDPIESYLLVANTSTFAHFMGRLEFSEPIAPPIIETAEEPAENGEPELERRPNAPDPHREGQD